MTDLSPAAKIINQIIDDLYDLPVRKVVAATLRVAAEELQYKLFLPGNDLTIVESRALFKLADELEGLYG
jgi:hypothetical protein